MPEVPENMQQNLAHLEHQAQGPSSQSGPQNYNSQGNSSSNHGRSPDGAYYSQKTGILQEYGQQQNGTSANGPQAYRPNNNSAPPEVPNFSPFPVLLHIPPNVPPTDDQREATLEAAREAVLASNDPETQLTWAQDALSYVEVAMQNEQRISATQPPRPQTPRVEHMLREDAMKIVRFLADQHHPKAEFLRGVWLEFGKFGYRIDKKEAFHCYSRALGKGYARAYYRIGMQFEQSNEPLKAISYYQKGVDAGDSAACYRLGMMALLGQHGQPQDFQRGLNLIFASAETADENAAQGAYVFGMLQARELAQVSIPERFLPLDVASARINIEKAAYLGFAKAQVKMGAAYELCEMGCEFSPALSLHYNALAARQGEADAEMAISKWFLCGYEGVFEKNEEMAFRYAQRAAVSGLGTAMFALGYFYEVGIYVSMNLKEAREWYSKAAANGNKDAAGRIESISRSKTISRKDHEAIAVSKIRKQHGSHSLSPNGVPLVPSLPPMPPAIEMPDPSRLSLHPYSYNKPYASNRPPSSAPYPVNGGASNRPLLASQVGTFSNPEHRPTSAFGINPNLRPNSAAALPGSRPDNYRPYGMSTQPLPYSSADSGGQGYANSNRLPSGPGPQSRPQPRPGVPSPSSLGGPSTQDSGPAPPVKADIGFVAPPDARQRLHRPMQPSTDMPQPHPPRTSSNLPVGSGPKQQKPTENPRPTAAANNKPLPSVASAKPSASSTKLSAPSAKPAPPASSARPPGKGPQTFEEMGVLQGKKDGDCVSAPPFHGLLCTAKIEQIIM
jgi:TPR repeat protein